MTNLRHTARIATYPVLPPWSTRGASNVVWWNCMNEDLHKAQQSQHSGFVQQIASKLHFDFLLFRYFRFTFSLERWRAVVRSRRSVFVRQPHIFLSFHPSAKCLLQTILISYCSSFSALLIYMIFEHRWHHRTSVSAFLVIFVIF